VQSRVRLRGRDSVDSSEIAAAAYAVTTLRGRIDPRSIESGDVPQYESALLSKAAESVTSRRRDEKIETLPVLLVPFSQCQRPTRAINTRLIVFGCCDLVDRFCATSP
jgi:hypothetical protein